MKFRKTIKKILALGTGATMMGATLMGAMAADLANYPAPFVSGGKFSGVMVVGDNANAADVIGVTDIATSLQFAVSGAKGGSAVSVAGDVWKVGTSTKILELSENHGTVSANESIATITTQSFIDDSELPETLANGVVSNSKGDAPYEQRMYFEDTTTGFVTYVEDSDDVTADFLYFTNGRQLARYELEFTTQLESDVDDSAGSASTTGTYLTDIEDSEIEMLGQKFTIVQARRNAAAGNGVQLILMGGATRDTLLEGVTKTYTIDGKDYEVTLDFVDSNSAKFTVNGESTRDLVDGDTDKMSDGTTLGVTEILYQDYAGGVHSADFFLGAQKLEIKDTNIGDTASTQEVKVDDETIDGANAWVEGTDDNSTFKVDKIVVNMSADDDYYVPAGGKLSANPELNEPELLFTKGWDIQYAGLTQEATEEINIKASGSDKYELEFTDGSGNKVAVPIAYTSGTTNLKMGDNDDDLRIREANTTSISKDDYFILTDESDDNGERQSYLLRYRGSDKLADDNPVIKFDDIGTGDRLERTLSAGTNSVFTNFNVSAGPSTHVVAAEVAQIKIGGGTFRVYNATSTKADDFKILVDLDGSNSLDDAIVSVNSKSGAAITFVNDTNASTHAGGKFRLQISTPNTDHFDDLQPDAITVDLTAASGEVALATSGGVSTGLITPQDDDDNSYGYTTYGAFVRKYSPSSDPAELMIKYPAAQSVPQVYVTGPGASITGSASSGASTTTATAQQIDVGAAKLASEVTNIKAVNAILVGGPCANAAAATILDNPADCTAGFEPGVGRVELYENDGKVAMLVAGYSALDTRNAAQVVAKYGSYEGQLKGSAIEVVRGANNVLTVAESTLKAGVAMVEEAPAEEPAAAEEAAPATE